MTSAKSRLLQRAQVVSCLHHPNLARMLPLPGGAGLVPLLNKAPRLDDLAHAGLPFQRLDLEHAVWIVLDVLGGLQALHDLPMGEEPFVHGAVCPRNILVAEPGSAQLIPIVNVHVMPGAPLERSGYVAPEQLLKAKVDHRADLFSVGVLLWEALSERRLFPEPSVDEALALLRRGGAPRVALRGGWLWAEPLVQVAARCLALDPSDRFQTALDVKSAIVAAVGPQLTRHDLSNDWASAAPRPSRPPRPPSAPRNLTPRAVVIDLSELSRTEVSPSAVPTEPAPGSALPESGTELRGARGRAGMVVLAAAGVLGAVALLLHGAGAASHGVAARPRPAVTLEAMPLAVPTLIPAPSAAQETPPAAAPALAPSTKIKRHGVLRPARPKKSPSARSADYGI